MAMLILEVQELLEIRIEVLGFALLLGGGAICVVPPRETDTLEHLVALRGEVGGFAFFEQYVLQFLTIAPPVQRCMGGEGYLHMTTRILVDFELVKHLAPILLLGVHDEAQFLESVDAKGCDISDGDGLETSIASLGRIAEALVLSPVAHHPGAELVQLQNLRIALAGLDLHARDAGRSVLLLVLGELLVVKIPRGAILELLANEGLLRLGHAGSLGGRKAGDLLVDAGEGLPGRGAGRRIIALGVGDAGSILCLGAEKGSLGIVGIADGLDLLLVEPDEILPCLGGRAAISGEEPKRPGLVLDPNVSDEAVLLRHAHGGPGTFLLDLLLIGELAPLTNFLDTGPPSPRREVRALPLNDGNLLGDCLGIEDVNQVVGILLLSSGLPPLLGRTPSAGRGRRLSDRGRRKGRALVVICVDVDVDTDLSLGPGACPADGRRNVKWRHSGHGRHIGRQLDGRLQGLPYRVVFWVRHDGVG
mmetsp:Transcript_17276/g.49489  ORF Transcript_17276/g.49489 Transcript_17276/m.49489 type:complete len:476 (-) Transcript_17276:224-1651(-)